MQTTYTKARENLAYLLDKVVNDREIIIIERRDKPSVALIAEDELASLKKTAYLLRSPKNAARLLRALECQTPSIARFPNFFYRVHQQVM